MDSTVSGRLPVSPWPEKHSSLVVVVIVMLAVVVLRTLGLKVHGHGPFFGFAVEQSARDIFASLQVACCTELAAQSTSLM